MNKHVRIIAQEARAVARVVGVQVHVENRKAGHPHIVVSGPGGTRRWTVPSSPSDPDFVIRNIRPHIRKIIKEVS